MYTIYGVILLTNCLYELLIDKVGDTITIPSKILYWNVITEKEVDKYQIRINDDNIKLSLLFNQTTSSSKLRIIRLINEEINFKNSEKFNKEYMLNAL